MHTTASGSFFLSQQFEYISYNGHVETVRDPPRFLHRTFGRQDKLASHRHFTEQQWSRFPRRWQAIWSSLAVLCIRIRMLQDLESQSNLKSSISGKSYPGHWFDGQLGISARLSYQSGTEISHLFGGSLRVFSTDQVPIFFKEKGGSLIIWLWCQEA